MAVLCRARGKNDAHKETRETALLPGGSGGQGGTGGEAVEDDVVDGGQNRSPEFLLQAGCVGRGRSSQTREQSRANSCQ
jgi:hypothetical protein